MSNYRSDEEKYFSWWLDELEEAGYISGYDYENKNWNLSESVNVIFTKILKTKERKEEKNILDRHSYGCDFTIDFEEKSRGYFFSNINQESYIKANFIYGHKLLGFVEVKAIFDRNNMTRLFSISRKWVWDKHGDFINLVKISNTKNSFFSKTFTPKRFLLTDKTSKPRSLKYEPITLEDYVKSITAKYIKLNISHNE